MDNSNNMVNDISNNIYNENQLMNGINEFMNQMNNEFMNNVFMPRLLPLRPRSLLQYLNENTTNYPPTMEDIIERSFNEKSKFKQIVSEEGLNQLEDVVYKVDNSGDFEYKSCPITTCDFEEGEILKKLPCGHVYNSEGILMWFKESNKCPLCRYEMPSKEIKNETVQQLPVQPPQPPQPPVSANNETETETDTETDTGQEDQDNIYNENMNRIYSILNSYRSPYSMLSNRRIIPHSYIEPIITNRIVRDEEEMLQQALMNSLQDTNNDMTNNDISNNDISNN